jgi:hypothetical protein
MRDRVKSLFDADIRRLRFEIEPLLFVFKFNWDVDDTVEVVVDDEMPVGVEVDDDESSVFCTRFIIRSIF